MSFKKLEKEDFVVSSNTITSTVWSNNAPSLNTFYTSSTQKNGSSGLYYLNVYQTASADSGAEVQFSIAYGDSTGGGNLDFDSGVAGVSPSTSIYGQYRTLVLEDENAQFAFGNYTGSYFYAISVERARYKEKLLPGSFNLVLSSSNALAGGGYLYLTDNSNDVTVPTYYGTQRAYQIISGSDGTAYTGSGHTPSSGSYGLFLPDISTIILNGAALDDATALGGGINLTSSRGSENGDNPSKLFRHISNASGSIFELNSQETITSDYVFIRTRNSEFNYSENPSFISGSTGEVIYDYFIDNPTVFPTTGLYNDANELVAVAKLSKPLEKDFTKESLIRVKLDF